MSEQSYEVSLRNTFDAHSPEEAVAMMVAWAVDWAAQAGYRVTLADDYTQSWFVDADDLDPYVGSYDEDEDEDEEDATPFDETPVTNIPADAIVTEDGDTFAEVIGLFTGKEQS